VELSLLRRACWNVSRAGVAPGLPEDPHTRERDMGLIVTLLVGLIVGAIAKLLVPGKDPGGWVVTILLGIAGAWVGTWLGRMLGLYRSGEAAGWIASIVGAVLLLLAYRAVIKRRGA
jgi:uncharacterized membrane protein YeaQ/YmgE (transglycosylase-associated protein family)